MPFYIIFYSREVTLIVINKCVFILRNYLFCIENINCSRTTLVAGHVDKDVIRIYFKRVDMRLAVLLFVTYLDNCFTCLKRYDGLILYW